MAECAEVVFLATYFSHAILQNRVKNIEYVTPGGVPQIVIPQFAGCRGTPRLAEFSTHSCYILLNFSLTFQL